MITPAELIERIQQHPRIHDAGMILTHFGIVRSFNLKGETVTKLEVRPDRDRAEAIRRDLLERPGVVEIIVELNEGELAPGDPIMLAAVAGETREQVFPVMMDLIDRLKAEASAKKETVVAG